MLWIYLSKKNSDEYIDRFARGSGALPTALESWNYEDQPDHGLVLRGIMKHKIIKRCWQDARPFRFMDTGYLGCRPNALNQRGWKIWHRVVDNNLQHDRVIPRPSDRWQRLGLSLKPWTNSGRNIVIVAPDEKPCVFYGIDQDQWIKKVVSDLRGYTDRPVIVRQRTADPDSRTRDPCTGFAAQLQQDVWAVITFNSVAAIESIMAGIPAFVLAPCNAARPVSNLDLAMIENPWRPDTDLIYPWLYHLAYGQFHNNELEDGTARRLLDENMEIIQ